MVINFIIKTADSLINGNFKSSQIIQKLEIFLPDDE